MGEAARWVEQYNKSSLFEQQRHRIFNAVIALWTVEHKTFIDIVLKVTRDTVIKRREEWLRFEIHQNKRIMESAVEDPDAAVKRMQLKQDIADLEVSLQELHKI